MDPRRAALALALVASPAPVLAGPRAPLPGLPAADEGGAVDVRFDYSHHDLLYDTRALTLGLRAQYVGARGLGGYLELPVVLGASGDQQEEERAVGNVTLGGMYVRRARAVDVFAHAGLAAAPWGSSPGLVPDALFVPRLPDALRSEGTWLFAGGGARSSGPGLQYGAALGLDVTLEDSVGRELEPFGSVAVALGYAHARASATVGVAFVYALGEGHAGLGDDFALGASATVAYDVNATFTATVTAGWNPHESVSGTSYGVGARARF